MTAAVVALLTVPAMAQNRMNVPSSSNMPRSLPPDPQAEQYRKEVDQDYRAASQKIPEQKKKVTDPWANVRSVEPAGKPKRAN
jgi:hypothetical protein